MPIPAIHNYSIESIFLEAQGPHSKLTGLILLPVSTQYASLVAWMVKNLPAMQDTLVQSLGLEDSLEKGMATHSSALIWRIPWTEEPHSPKESDTTERLSTHISQDVKWSIKYSRNMSFLVALIHKNMKFFFFRQLFTTDPFREQMVNLGSFWCRCSVPKSCPTLWDPMNQSTPGFSVLHCSQEFAQTHVHWVGDSLQPSQPLLRSSPFVFNLSQHQGLF